MQFHVLQAIPELDTPVGQTVPRKSDGVDSETDWEDEEGRGVSLSSKV